MTSSAEARRQRLEDLLGEGRSAVVARQSQAFDRAAEPFGGRMVIYGAGGLGQRLLAGLRASGGDALAFADRNPAAWSSAVAGLPVFPPEEAVRRFGQNALFVVAVWNPVATGGLHTIACDLTAMGCRAVAPFVWLAWKYPEALLPNFLWDLPSRVIDAAGDVRRAFDLFEGRRSQAEYLRHLEFRLTGDFGCLLEPDGDPQYFPRRLFRSREDEYFVDCGAYNGDTLSEFANWTRGCFRGALALEADPANFAALENTVATDPRLRGRVRAVPQAVGSERCTLRFTASASPSSAISTTGGIVVQCSPLDELLEGENPTYIKMDIEGAEPDSLRGADAVLRRSRPALAICVYHLQEHMWQLPLQIRQALPDARLFLRPYCVNGFDLVCYAVPPVREIAFSYEDVDR